MTAARRKYNTPSKGGRSCKTRNPRQVREVKPKRKLRSRRKSSGLRIRQSCSSPFLSSDNSLRSKHSQSISEPATFSSHLFYEKWQGLRRLARQARKPYSYYSSIISPLVLTPGYSQPFLQLPHFEQIPNVMSIHSSLNQGTTNSGTLRHPNLIQVIERLEVEEKDRIRLHGLVTCAEEFKQSQGRQCKCIDITSLGHGSWNCAYKLTFNNGDTMAALVSNYEQKSFSRKMKESEIATMRYLHSSPKYNKHIKVPEVYAWDLSHTNKAGAPYIFREVIEGRDLSREFSSLTKEQKLAVTTAIAKVHKVLSQPAEFQTIGGIYGSPEEGFHTGQYPGNWSEKRSYLGIQDLWQEKLASVWRLADQRSTGADSGPRTLTKNIHNLEKLMPHFSPSGKLATLCIQHFDLAIRNVIFNDNFEITGVIDWEYAQVVPLAVAAKIPLDFTGDPILSKVYAAAYADVRYGTSSDDFDNSTDYIHFHDLIMGPMHAIGKKSVTRWAEAAQDHLKFQRQPRQQKQHYDCTRNPVPLRLPQELGALLSVDGEGPELAGNGCS